MVRPKNNLRNSRPVKMAAGTALLVIPGSAVALTTGALAALAAPTASVTPISFHVDRHRLEFGQDAVVYGKAAGASSGQPLALEYKATGSDWQTVATTVTRSGGRFRFRAPLEHSGLVRVVASSAGHPGVSFSGATRPYGITPTPAATSTSPAGVSPTPAGVSATAGGQTQRVTVAADLSAPSRQIALLSGQGGEVRGRLLPHLGGRLVRLESRSPGGKWHMVARARTGSAGRYDLRFTAGGLGSQHLRVDFEGDRLNSGARTRSGDLTVYRESVASWYNDGGNTGCGFHAGYGVANVSLPCGTKVTFQYNGRRVTATVDDRGPYVGGRTWDLNQNTAAALGFGGVGTVWSSV